MFIISKTYTFEASHQLEHHDGKCHNLHGHSYKLTVELASNALKTEGPETNMVQDFHQISLVTKKLMSSHLDHRHLNDTLCTDSPTAEFIAYWIFHRLKPALPLLTAVKLQETHSSLVEYRPGPFLPSPVRAPALESEPPPVQIARDDDEPRSDDALDASPY